MLFIVADRHSRSPENDLSSPTSRYSLVRWLSIPATCNARHWIGCDAQAVGLRCLIVDDNASFVAAAQAVLEGAELTMAGKAANTAEALALADELAPDVILLDIDLGGESGLDLAWKLHRRTRNRRTHIVLISAYPQDDFADLVAEAPAVGFVGKSQLSVTAIVDLVRRDQMDGNGKPHSESR